MAGAGGAVPSTAGIYVDWLKRSGRIAEAECCLDYLSRSGLGVSMELTGPVGERNVYSLRPRGAVAAVGTTEAGLLDQIGAILATGNTVIVDSGHPAAAILDSLPGEIASQLRREPDWLRIRHLKAVLFEGDAEDLMALNRKIASLDGPILSILAAKPAPARPRGPTTSIACSMNVRSAPTRRRRAAMRA